MQITQDLSSIGVRYVELGSSTWQCGAASTWTDKDLSALVPVGVKAVHIKMTCGAGPAIAGVRGKGSVLDRTGYTGITAAFVIEHVDIVTPDANRMIQCYDNVANINTFRLLGYFL